MSDQKDDQKYDPTVDIQQSGVRYVQTEEGDDAVDFLCERVAAGVGEFTNIDNMIDIIAPIDPNDNDDDDDDDPLDRLFDLDNFPQPFIELVLKSSSDIFKKDSNLSIIEFLFNATFSLLFHYTQEFDNNIDKLSLILSKQDDHFSELNIKLLCLLFNLIPSGNAAQRALVMQRLLDLGRKSKNYLAKLFRNRLCALDSWICNEWNNVLSVESKKKLYQSASLVARKAGDADQAQTFLIKYLQLFDIDATTSSISDDVINEASQAVISAISSKSFNTRVVMELTKSYIVSNVMSKNLKFVKLYELLNIVYSGYVTDFIKFYKINQKYVDDLGLSYDELICKMRLLTLCSLGNSNKTNHSFTDLKDILHLNDQNKVEELIIDAVEKKLLYAKIDYSTEQVEITRAKQRIFNQNTWNDLAKKLSLWKTNTNTILQIIHNAGLNRWRQQYLQEKYAKKSSNT